MNPACEQCKALCCKVAWFPCSVMQQEFMLMTRACASVPGGVLVNCLCVHLGRDNKCKIYDVRPDACRNWEVDGKPCKIVRKAVEK